MTSLGVSGPMWHGYYTSSQMLGYLRQSASSAADTEAYDNFPSTLPNGSAGYYLTNAQMKALGLKSANASGIDGYVGFSSTYPWTYNDSAGVAPGTYGLVSCALHEISIILGRSSALPGGAGLSVLDAFRCVNGTWTYAAGGTFSIDGCRTPLAQFTTSSDLGDWNGADQTDACNAYASAGVKTGFTIVDNIVLDVIGYKATVAPPTVSILDLQTNAMPSSYCFFPNYPNPFNPSTTLRIGVPGNAGTTASIVSLLVYSISGKRVSTLHQGALEPGYHVFTWNGRDDQGNAVAAGRYAIRMTAGKFKQQRMAILNK